MTRTKGGTEAAQRRTWQEFLRAHWEVLAAADFFTIEVWTFSGLVPVVVLFVIELSTRRVEIARIHTQPDGAWMTQISRNLTDDFDGFLADKRYLILDRDPLFTLEFRETLAAAGVNIVRLPPRSPNLNAYAERFVRSIKESCLDRMILFGERSLHRTIKEFVAHYDFERNHQGLDNRLIFPDRRNSKRPGRVTTTTGWNAEVLLPPSRLKDPPRNKNCRCFVHQRPLCVSSATLFST